MNKQETTHLHISAPQAGDAITNKHSTAQTGRHTLEPGQVIMNEQDAISEFERLLISFGFELENSIQPSSIIMRCKVKGDEQGTRSGYYVMGYDEEGLWGIYGSLQTRKRHLWTRETVNRRRAVDLHSASRPVGCAPSLDSPTSSDEEIHPLMRTLRNCWSGATAADPTHPYLVRNSVMPFGIRQNGSQLLVPMRERPHGEVCGIQQIEEDGHERTVPGSQPTGAFHMFGTPHDAELIVIVDGYATAARLYQQADKSVAFALAFGKQNLITVGNAMDLHYRCALSIAADLDHGEIVLEAEIAAESLAADIYHAGLTPLTTSMIDSINRRFDPTVLVNSSDFDA